MNKQNVMQQENAKIKASRIIDLSIKYWSIEREKLLSRNKYGILPIYKAMMTFLILEQTEISLKNLAILIGIKDHTSIIHRRESMSNLIKEKHPLIHQYYYYKKAIMMKTIPSYDWEDYFQIINDINYASN